MREYSQYILLLAMTASAAAISITQLWEFPGNHWIENIAVRPNNRLLLTTFDQGRLYDFDPTIPGSAPQIAAQLPSASALTGIAPIGPDLFAVSGGQLNLTTLSFAPGSLKVYTVDFSNATNNAPPVVGIAASVADTIMLNGMLSLPAYPHVILSADSIGGRIFRINTATGQYGVVVQDPLLGPGDEAGRPPLGVNGIRFRDGQVYWTNSAQRTYGRFPVSDAGDVIGAVHVLSRFNSSDTNVAFDDFALDADGVAYVARHPQTLVNVDLDGRETVLAGARNSSLLRDPTSAAFSNDGLRLYVVTGGALDDGVVDGGQVVEVIL